MTVRYRFTIISVKSFSLAILSFKYFLCWIATFTLFLKLNPYGYGQFLDPYFKVLWEGVKQNLLNFFIGASAIKSFVRSRIFRYGLPKDILRKGQKNKGGGRKAPHPPPLPWAKGINIRQEGKHKFTQLLHTHLSWPPACRLFRFGDGRSTIWSGVANSNLPLNIHYSLIYTGIFFLPKPMSAKDLLRSLLTKKTSNREK